MKEYTFSPMDQPKRHPYLVMGDVKGERYLFHSKKNVFLTLNATAFDILDLCDGKNSILDILSTIAGRYDKNPDDIARDIVEYLVTLKEAEILTSFNNEGDLDKTPGNLF